MLVRSTCSLHTKRKLERCNRNLNGPRKKLLQAKMCCAVLVKSACSLHTERKLEMCNRNLSGARKKLLQAKMCCAVSEALDVTTDEQCSLCREGKHRRCQDMALMNIILSISNAIRAMNIFLSLSVKKSVDMYIFSQNIFLNVLFCDTLLFFFPLEYYEAIRGNFPLPLPHSPSPLPSAPPPSLPLSPPPSPHY